jgi:hypothetical protein
MPFFMFPFFSHLERYYLRNVLRADIKMRFAAQKILNRGLLFSLCYTL